jgi:hypothetical protein
VTDETPTPNIPLLRKAVEWAEVEAKRPPQIRQWYQATYTVPEEDRIDMLNHEPGCGTAYCIAGYVGALLDERFANAAMTDTMHVEDFATDALGLTDRQACLLFSGGNSIEMVRQVAEQIAESVGEKL